MSEAAVRIISLLLAAIFLWAAVAKVARFGSWRVVLAGYRIPPSLERLSAPAVPFVELLVVGLLLAGETRAGAALSVMLLSTFSLALVRARALQGDRLPCGCFGAHKERDYRVLLLRNGLLAVLPAALLVEGRDVMPLADFGWPSTGDALPTLLTLAGIAVGLWIVREVASSFRKGRS
jgi:hypothetical protein